MKRLKVIGLTLLLFLFTFSLLFTLLFALLYCLQRFIGFEDYLVVYISLGASAILSIVNVIISRVSSTKIHQSKLTFWIKNNYPKVIFAYIITLILLISISKEPIWNADETREAVSVEWTIFFISITIFLVWNVLYVNYLKNKQPKLNENMDSRQLYNALLKKQSLYSEIVSAKSSIILLLINLLLLSISTGMVYISHKPESIITQNTVICSFFFSTNTIVVLFIDILKPILHENKELKEHNEITKNEMEVAESKALLQTIQEDVINTIDDLEPSEQERARATLRIIEGLNKILDESTKENQETETDNKSQKT